MKKLIFSLMLSVLFLATSTAQRGYDRTGYDGDFFSLEGTLDVFKNSHSIKDFERRLNTRDSWVNNLDLNLDGQTDYIRVEHRRQGDYHAIILQVPISRREVQDVAVIEIEKTGRRRATLQIVGDEYLYGEQVIVEPFEGDGYSSGRGGPNADYNFRRGYVNVYYWPSVRWILRRSYNPWISPYRYSYYPTWWSPWRPSPWDTFYPNIIVYNRFYQIVYVHRLRNVYNFYRPYRVYCPSVYQRTNVVRIDRTNRRVTPSFSKARVKQRANLAQTNVAKGKNGRISPTGRTTTSGVNPPRSTAGKATRSKKDSRVANNQSAQKPTSRYTPRTKTERSKTSAPTTRYQPKSQAKSSRSNSTYSPKSSSSSRTNKTTSRSSSRSQATSPSRSSRSKASSSSRSNRSSRASSSSSRNSNRATSRSSSRSNRSSSTRSSRSTSKSLPRVAPKSSSRKKRG